MRPTILLFDIDGTLIRSRGAGRRAMQTAFRKLHEVPDALDFRFDGMTDRMILRAGLLATDPNLSEAAITERTDRLLDVYLEHLHGEITPDDIVTLCAGVTAVVDEVRALPGVVVGLGTGNVRRGAAIKLGRVGLFDRFAFGGFGDQHVEREHILASGVREGAERLGVSPDGCRVVVIGDTPRDIAAARLIGAESLAVATGSFTVDELAALAPTLAVATLEDPRARALFSASAGN